MNFKTKKMKYYKKKYCQIIFILASLFISNLSKGQIIYTADNYSNIEDTFNLSITTNDLSGFDFTQTGENYLWDYESLDYSEQTEIKWINPNDGGYKNIWCISNEYIFNCNNQFNQYVNLAKYKLDSLTLGLFELSNVVDHLFKSENALEYKMMGITINVGEMPIPIPIEYDDIDTIYNFPLQYLNQDSSTSSYAFEIEEQAIRYVSYKKRNNIIEGWGELRTPYKNYDNVLKMKTIIAKKDTMYSGENIIPYIDTLIQYKWFDTNYGIPVLQAEGRIIASNIVISKISYLDTLRCVTPTALFAYNPPVVYWDSATHTADLEFINLSNRADSSYWNFGDGNTSYENSPYYSYTCPGTYLINLEVYNKLCNPYASDTLTLPLIVIDTTLALRSFIDTTQCESYISPSGKILTETGFYLDTLQCSYGCDSIITIDLTILNNTSYVISESACETYTSPSGNYTWTNSGTYFDTIPNFVGCDSIITIELTINEVDISVTQNQDSLTANAINATFQWVNCNDNYSIIQGATDSLFVPEYEGYYAVIVEQNSCTDTSECYYVEKTGINNLSKNNIKLYPNPTKGTITVEFKNRQNKTDITIKNVLGRIIEKISFTDTNKKEFEISGKNGIYFIEIIQNNKKTVFKLIKNE